MKPMNFKHLCSLLSLALAVSLSWLTPAAQRDLNDEVRDAFLVTRQKISAEAGSKPATSPRATRRRSTGARLSTGRIGLGYTLYKRDADGQPVRISPAQEFHQGDAVRLVVEPNIDGYLYVFHTENDGPPEMIFPDARLHGGDNRVERHVPYEVPSSKETDPNFRWFIFNENAAIERLYIVVTRRPLLGVPTGKVLTAHCRTRAGDCVWRPKETILSPLIAKVDAAVNVNQSHEYGQALTADEREAAERGLGLPPGAPVPSVVKMNQSLQARMLVTLVSLVHK